jgi:hypothetical protein
MFTGMGLEGFAQRAERELLAAGERPRERTAETRDLTAQEAKIARLMEVIGPPSSEGTMQMLEFARSNRLPFKWRHPDRADDPSAAELAAGLDASSRSCACRAACNCAHRPPVRSPGRSQSAASRGRERRST